MIIFPPDINYIESNDTKVAPANEIKSAAPSSADRSVQKLWPFYSFLSISAQATHELTNGLESNF